jgi:pre-mRNA cleavage complex 2 protein Pcf11
MSSWQQPQTLGYRAPENSIDTLNSDIANLIAAAKAEFAQNPWNSSIQTRLKALLDLQTILSSQRLPPNQIALIKDQVAQLSEASHPPPRMQTPPASLPSPAPIAVTPATSQQPSLSSILGSGALAALLARQSSTPQPTAPTSSVAPIRSPPQSRAQTSFNPLLPHTSSSTPVADPNSLLERLRAAGMLPSVPGATSSASLPPGTLAGSVPLGFPPPLPFTNTPPHTARTTLAEIPNDVVLKPASLKM